MLLYSRKYFVVQQLDDTFLGFSQPWVATAFSNFADVKRICQRKRDNLCKQTPEQRHFDIVCLSLLHSHLKNGHHFYVDRKNTRREGGSLFSWRHLRFKGKLNKNKKIVYHMNDVSTTP